MECDLNGFQSIRYVNGHVDILYSYDVYFAVQYGIGIVLMYYRARVCSEPRWFTRPVFISWLEQKTWNANRLRVTSPAVFYSWLKRSNYGKVFCVRTQAAKIQTRSERTRVSSSQSLRCEMNTKEKGPGIRQKRDYT